MINNEDQGKWARDINGELCKIAFVSQDSNFVILVSITGALFFQSKDVIDLCEFNIPDYKVAFENLISNICEKERKRYLEMDRQRKEKRK